MQFLFTNERTLTHADIEALDWLRQEQFVITMHGYCEVARACSAPPACVEALGDDADAYVIEVWDVVRAGVVVYEYWVQGAGDGQVFVAGTAESTYVHSVVQHRFQALVDDRDAEERARAADRHAHLAAFVLPVRAARIYAMRARGALPYFVYRERALARARPPFA